MFRRLVMSLSGMQHLSLLAILPLAWASPAAASPDAPKPAPQACRPSGPVLFEIDHRVEPGAKLATSAIKVFASGAWTRDEADADGKPLAQTSGCFAKPDVKQLDATVHAATWKRSIARIHCMAMSSAFTVFQVDGKPVFTQHVCGHENLDDASRAKLDAAVAQVEHEIAKAP